MADQNVVDPHDPVMTGENSFIRLSTDGGKTVFMFNGDEEHPVRIELHQAEDGQATGIDHLSFTVEDPADATREVKMIGGVDFKFEPFENQQSGRTISNTYDPDGIQIQMARKTGPGTYKNWE